jgi:hypothetical protein
LGEVAASAVITASLAEVWEFYFDTGSWDLWVDGFAAIESVDGYPLTGGGLVWKSVPAGRGEVSESVLEHEPRSLHRVKFTDPESSGEQTTRFAIEPGSDGGATRVSLELSYEPKTGAGFLGGVVDLLFVRSQMRRSLERTLARLRLEVEQRSDN